MGISIEGAELFGITETSATIAFSVADDTGPVDAEARVRIGGEVRADLQRNSRIGVTLAYPFGRRHAIKAGYSIGVVTESGGDFQMFLLGYLVRL